MKILLLITGVFISVITMGQSSFGFAFRSNAKDSVIVEKVFAGSPALKAGLKANDLITFVNGNTLIGKSQADILSYLKFLPETNNAFVIKRNNKPLTLKLDKAPVATIFDCISGSCSNGPCELRFMSGVTISGNCKNSMITGLAIMKYPNGNTAYAGTMINNQPDGKGKMIYPDSSIYEGDFVKGNRRGTGKYTLAGGGIYIGEWFNNKRHGKGEWTDKEGNTYKGEYKNDVMEGKGVFYFFWLDNKYEGDFKNNLPDGKGTYTYKDGRKYIGAFVKGEYDGKGKLIETNGDVTEGEWKNNKMNGRGTCIFKDGRKFEGVFKDNNTVNGTLTYADGKKITGDFNNFEPVSGKASITYKDGRKETYSGIKNEPQSPGLPNAFCDGLKKVLEYSKTKYKDIRVAKDSCNYLLPGTWYAMFLMSFPAFEKNDLCFNLNGFDNDNEEQNRKQEQVVANEIKRCLGPSFNMTVWVVNGSNIGHQFTNGTLTISLLNTGPLTFSYNN